MIKYNENLLEFVMFFDNASTTRVSNEIIRDLSDINDKYFFNPGGLYRNGRNAKLYLEDCRKNIVDILADRDEYDVVFTGSATEANNLALFGNVKKNTRKILVSMGEHPSVYNSALELKQRGFDVEFVNLSPKGCVDFEDFKMKMTNEVDLVSIMHVSNETGAINNISELVEYAKVVNSNVIFHVDGVQACGKIPVDLNELDVDLYTISAHKIHGFKGVGALFIKKGIHLKPIIFGGGQEGGLRSGTENLIGIYSLKKALELTHNKMKDDYQKVLSMKSKFLELLSKTGLDYVVHSNDECSPYIISISFIGCRAETLLNMLSDNDVCVGNGSACSSKNSGNRILENMGISRSEIESNLRISFSRDNTIDELGSLVDLIKSIVGDYLKKVK